MTANKPSGEFDLIELISKTISAPSTKIIKGIGDDAAVIAPDQLLCSDCMVEGIHFDLKLTRAEDVGYKAVATCLSDIAAMNGRPIAVVISIALPTPDEKFLTAFYKGVEKLRKEIEFDLVGGDLSKSPGPIFIDVAATGSAQKPIYRSGAKPGDILAVSGHLGTSAAGFYSMQNWQTLKEISGALMQAHQLPKPRFDLDASTATSLIDVSDGLASEANHIAKASRVSIEIAADKIPILERVITLAERTNQNAENWALYGGEDYELLATFPAALKIPAGFTVIGRIVEQNETLVTLMRPDQTRESLRPGGHDHFTQEVGK